MPRPSTDPEFGRLIPCRRTSHAAWLAAVVISMYTCILTVSIPTAFPPGKVASLHDTIVMFAFIAAGVLGLIAIAYHEGKSIRFYETGVVRKQFGFTITRLAYADCVTHDYRMTHMRHNLGYDSTVIRLCLGAADGRRVRYFGTHRLKAKRTGRLFFSRKFEIVGENPIEFVAWRVAWIMAMQWVEQLDAGESINWTKFTTLTPDGIVAWDGPLKHTIALYTNLQPIDIDHHGGHVRMRDGRPYTTLDTSEPNFYPGYLTAFAMIDRVSPDSETIDDEAT